MLNYTDVDDLGQLSLPSILE